MSSCGKDHADDLDYADRKPKGYTEMTIPSAWVFLVLSAAAYRTWRLLAVDEIGDRPRNWFLDRAPFLEKWLRCPWCAGTWIATAWWGAWQVWPDATRGVASLMGIWLLVGLTARNLDP